MHRISALNWNTCSYGAVATCTNHVDSSARSTKHLPFPVCPTAQAVHQVLNDRVLCVALHVSPVMHSCCTARVTAHKP